MGCGPCKQIKFEDGEEVIYKDKPCKIVSSTNSQYGYMYKVEYEDGTQSTMHTIPHNQIKKKEIGAVKDPKDEKKDPKPADTEGWPDDNAHPKGWGDVVAAMYEKGITDAQGAFELLDTDHTGTISAQEILDALPSLGMTATLEECQDMITHIDKDGDGEINMDEFLAWQVELAREQGIDVPEDEGFPSDKEATQDA